MQSVLFKITFAPVTSPIFAVAITTVTQFRDLISSGTGIMVILSFLFGVVSFIYGIFKRESDPAASKNAFISAFLFGIAVPAVSLMFAIGGSSGAVVDPKFS